MRKGFALPLIILCIVIVLLGTYFFLRQTNIVQKYLWESHPDLIYQSPAASPQQTPISESTNWKTFHNDKISFSYPNNWQLSQPNGLVIVVDPDLKRGIRIDDPAPIKETNLDDWYSKTSTINDPTQVIELISFSGEKAYELFDKSLNTHSIIIFHNSKPFAFAFTYPSIDLYNKVVASFKFLN